MNGNIYKSAGLTIGIVVGLILAIALILIANNNRKVRSQYDERQQKVRGDAYRYAFYSLVIYEVIMFILGYGEFSLPVPGYVLHFAGVLIACLVLSGYCIWKDAYWGLNNNRRRYGIILIIGGLLNVIPVVAELTARTGDAFPYVNLLVCIMLTVVGMELLLKHLIDRHADKEGSDP